MTLAIILVIAAVLSLAVVFRIAISGSLQLSGKAGIAGQIQPIDVVAFRNLIDPEEDAYLRRRLPAAEFRMIQRKRLCAMAAYVQTAKRNAALLIDMGQRALADDDSQTSQAARQLMNDAILLRRNTTVAMFRIYVARASVAMALPNSRLAASPVVESYEQLNGSAMLLGRLQNPMAPTRIAATM